MPDMPQRTMPRVRVVVLNWNSWWFTRRCLRALARTDHPPERLEVVLVDNASVDGSLELLRHEFPDVRVIANEANLGFAEGCNRAMRDLDGVDAVALVNNDAVVEPGWLAPLVAALEHHPRAGAAAARLVLEPTFVRLVVAVRGSGRVQRVSVDGIDATSRTRFAGRVRTEGRTEWPMELEHHLEGDADLLVPVGPGAHTVRVDVSGEVGLELRSGDRLGASGAGSSSSWAEVHVVADDPRVELLNGLGTDRNDVAESFDRHFGEPNDASSVAELDADPFPVTGFSGGGVLLRTAMLRQVGLFDPSFFAYYEDSDLSWRAARAGWSTVAVPASVIRHSFGGSGGSRAPGFFFLNYRNWLLTVLRNGTASQRRAARSAARERSWWAVRANVASPVKHRRRPDTDLVRAWVRTIAGTVVVRLAARRRGGLPGARPTTRVHHPFQPVFEPRGPARRPGGPVLIALDLGSELDRSGGPGVDLLRSLVAADESLDVVVVRRDAGGGAVRVDPARLAVLLGVPVASRPLHPGAVGPVALPAATASVWGDPTSGLLHWELAGRSGAVQRGEVPVDAELLAAAVTAASEGGPAE